jgi:hypothetical protein
VRDFDASQTGSVLSFKPQITSTEWIDRSTPDFAIDSPYARPSERRVVLVTKRVVSL